MACLGVLVDIHGVLAIIHIKDIKISSSSLDLKIKVIVKLKLQNRRNKHYSTARKNVYCKTEERAAKRAQVLALKDKGYSNMEIARKWY